MPATKKKKTGPKRTGEYKYSGKKWRKYQKYLAQMKKINKQRLAKRLAPLQILPFDDVDQESVHIRMKQEKGLKPEKMRQAAYAPWPCDSFGHHLFFDNEQQTFFVPSNNQQAQMASEQRVDYLFKVFDMGYKLLPHDFKAIKYFYGNRKYNPDICDKVQELAEKEPVWDIILMELRVTAETHGIWRKTKPEYNQACKNAQMIMDGKLTRKFFKRHDKGQTNDNTILKIIERRQKFTWEDPKVAAQKDANDTIKQWMVGTHANFVNPQSTMQFEDVPDAEDPVWTDRELLR